ncbi:MAG TPA: S9 family peptidase, partial [Candidatus Limnocylindrales bacterium]
AETGEARRLTDGPTAEEEPVWSPDGTRIAFVANRRRDHDLRFRRDIFVIDAETGKTTPITAGGESIFGSLAWLPDGKTIAALGGRLPANTYRYDIWLFAADGSDARADGGRNISDPHDLMPGSGMNSDVTIGEGARLIPAPDGRSLLFLAPIDGSYELWRIAVSDGRVERLTEGRHFISSFDAVAAGRGRAGVRAAFIRSAPTELPEVHVADIGGARAAGARTVESRRVTTLNADVASELDLRDAVERRWTVDGREIQGWLIAAGDGRQPLVTEIHGGPHSLYGWSPVWEFQILAANGMSVFYPNPRGSEGYGRAFNEANLGDWGPGPMKDVLAGVDALVADGLADPKRLGVTGGSYGGYLTNWILAHDQRFAAGFTARSVSDMLMLFVTGDISGGEWGEQEFGRVPWLHPDYYREISPLTYAHQIRTPLLIQHSEKDLRTTIGQAEALFTVLRSHRRPVRLMRVPDETHELTRSGTPFRRVENLVQVRDWFRHFLVEGKTALPPLPKARAGK